MKDSFYLDFYIWIFYGLILSFFPPLFVMDCLQSVFHIGQVSAPGLSLQISLSGPKLLVFGLARFKPPTASDFILF